MRDGEARSRAPGALSLPDTGRRSAKGGDAANVPLDQAMTAHPVTLAPDQKAIDALRAMSDGGFRHIPVLDRGRIVGVVSRADFKGVEIDRLDEEEGLAERIL